MKLPTRLRDAITSIALVAAIAFTVLTLTACGGGGDDADGKPDQTIGRPDCSASGVCT